MFAATCISHEDIMLSEMSQPQKDKRYPIPLPSNTQNRQPQRQEVEKSWPGWGEEGDEQLLRAGHRYQPLSLRGMSPHFVFIWAISFSTLRSRHCFANYRGRAVWGWACVQYANRGGPEVGLKTRQFLMISLHSSRAFCSGKCTVVGRRERPVFGICADIKEWLISLSQGIALLLTLSSVALWKKR